MVSGTKSIIALFGGPKRGLSELVSREQSLLKQHVDFWVNTIPDQGTETVRLEEALLISLGILNNSVGNLLTKPGYYGNR
jgi:predicted SPOUT superfamily RNA methylase MTH1